MQSLNLINSARSDIHYERMNFPDGQPHIKLNMESVGRLDKTKPLRIFTRMVSADDLLILLFVKDSLSYLGFTHIELHLTYLLAARMDRVMLDGEPFSLRIIAKLINTANFNKLLIWDNHSDVSTALIENSYTITNHQFVANCIADYYRKHPKDEYCLVSPDAGALKKIHKLAQYLNMADVVECMKERDILTGKLISFKTAEDDLQGKTCFIVDDICDGGGTFAGTAKTLKEKNAGKIILIVSHGIFSKGFSIPGIDHIYCTNSYRELPAESGIICYDIANYM